MSDYEISELMNNKNVEKITLELWSSDYIAFEHVFTSSSAYKMIIYNSSEAP